MKPTLERLIEEFTQLIGPDAFAKARAAQSAAAAAAAEAAKAAAAKAAAAAAAAKAAQAAAVPAGTPFAALPTPAKPTVPAAAVPAASSVAQSTTAPGAAASAAPRPVAPPAAVPRAVAPATPAVTRPAAAPAVPTPPPLPVEAVVHAAKGYDLDAIVASTQVVTAARILDRAGFALDAITGVDWLAQSEMEVVYDFFHPTERLRVVIRTRVPRATPELPTISTLFPGANWHEREAHDFFGIHFEGHPNLKPFLLPEDAQFHPLRKDYQP